MGEHRQCEAFLNFERKASLLENAQNIEFWLGRLGQKIPAALTWEALTEGVSGSSTYRLHMPHADVILKVTNSLSPTYMIERARREVAFYRNSSLVAPLPIPQLLGAFDESDVGCALLLLAYEPMKNASQWNRQDYLEVVDQLARFHSIFWDKIETLAGCTWLRPLSEEPGIECCSPLPAWQKLREAHPEALAEFTEKQIEEALGLASNLLTELKALPLTLCHNDFHTGNLLTQDGRILWADWQEVGKGYGVNDLSFLHQRAEIPPDREVIRAYQKRLEIETSQSIPCEAIWRGVAASELWTRMNHWPNYLIDGSSDRVHFHIHRIKELQNCV